MRSKIIKTIGILFVALILLIVGISVFTQTDYFRNTIKSVVEKAVSSATGQTFTIGKIEGDLMRGLRLKDISFKIEGKPFIYTEEFSVKYSLLLILDSSMLFSRVVPVKDISFRGISVNLIRDKDGNWNFNKLGGKKVKKDKEEQKEPPNWSILIEKFLFKDVKITLDDRKKEKLTKIDVPELDFSLKTFGITKKIELNLNNGDIYVSPNQINIKGLSTKATYTENEAQIKNLEANLNGAEIKFDGEVKDFTEPKFKFKAAAYGFNIEKGVLNAEVEGSGQYKSPEDIQAEIEIKLPDSQIMGKKVWGSIEKIKMAGTNVELQNGVVKTEFGETSFKGNAKLDRILKKEGLNEFNFKISLKDIALSKIPDLIKKQLDIGIVNADFDINGKWKEIEDLKAKVNINKFQQKGKLGEVNLRGLVEATKSNAKFDLVSNLNKVNLSSVLKDEKYTSNLNSNLLLKGSVPLSGDLLNNLTATVQGEILPSSVSDINLTGGEINASYTGEILDIKSLSLISDSFTLKAKGARRKEKGMDFSYEAEVKNLNFISKFLPELDLKGSLKAAGRVQGEIKNPEATLSATVSDFGYKKDLQVKSINLSGDTVINLENPEFQVKGSIKEIKFQERKVRSVDLQVRSEGKGIRGNFSILEDPQRSYEIRLKLADLKAQEKNIRLEKIRLNLKDRVLENKDVISLTIFPKRLIVKSFNLYYKDNFILGDTNVGFDGTMSADLELKRINFADISQVLGIEPPIQGTSSANISLKGTVEQPNIRVNLNAANLEFMDFKSDETSLNLSYSNKKLSLNLDVTENARKILLASGRADVDLNFKKIGENLKDATFDITLKSSGFDLSPLTQLNKEIREIHGKTVIDLRASGSIKSPKVNGHVKLQDVSLRTQSLRNEIKVTNGLIEMMGEKGFIKTLEIQADGGRGTFQGDFDLRELSYNLSGKMDDFQVKLKEIEAKLDSNIGVKGSEGKTYISGNVKMRRARIRIPEIPTKKVEDIKFVDERKETEEEFVIKETTETDYFRDNVGMDLKVSIPGNAWVKGKGANIEIKASLGVNKKYGEPIIITGNVDTIRGTYEFFGKLFRVEEGKVSFPGTAEINPFLDVRALYRVSNVNIFVNVSGRAKKPDIKLSSDPPMGQTDIFSYLAFGTSSDKIGAGERASLEQKAAQFAGSMAAGRLKDIVGEKFALDVISIRVGEKGPEAEVGKYLTDKLYVAYERDYTPTPSSIAPSGSRKSSDFTSPLSSSSITANTSNVLTNKARIEYRLFDFLTLEGEVGGEQVGGDVFFEFNY